MLLPVEKYEKKSEVTKKNCQICFFFQTKFSLFWHYETDGTLKQTHNTFLS